MKDQDSDKKDDQVPAERTQGAEFNPDREDSPSADWIQHANEETVIISQHGKQETKKRVQENSAGNSELSKSSGN